MIYQAMKKKLNLLELLLCLSFVGLTAQTPYFYYYKGEKQYLELDTRYAFVSTTDSNETIANRVNPLARTCSPCRY
jgi:hypothetical protein